MRVTSRYVVKCCASADTTSDISLADIYKYKERIFRVPQMDQWLYIVTGRTLVDNLRHAPENTLSMEAAMADVCSLHFIVAKNSRFMRAKHRYYKATIHWEDKYATIRITLE